MEDIESTSIIYRYITINGSMVNGRDVAMGNIRSIIFETNIAVQTRAN